MKDTEMLELNNRYYDKDGYVKQDIDGRILKTKDGLKSMYSEIDRKMVDDNEYFFDLLELKGAECIRLNFTRYNSCGCKYILTNKEGIVRLRDFLNQYLGE